MCEDHPWMWLISLCDLGPGTDRKEERKLYTGVHTSSLFMTGDVMCPAASRSCCLVWAAMMDCNQESIHFDLSITFFQSILLQQQKKKLGHTWYKLRVPYALVTMSWIVTSYLPWFTKCWAEKTGHSSWKVTYTNWATFDASGGNVLLGLPFLVWVCHACMGKSSSLFPPCWSQMLNSVCKICWQVPAATESSHRLVKLLHIFLSKAKWNQINQL